MLKVIRSRRFAVRVLAALAVLTAALPVASAGAIQGGTLDGDLHSNVGQISVGCSGTLIAPRVVLTAGHCTLDASRVTVTFDTDGFAGGSHSIAGTAHTTPFYNPKVQLQTLNDIGVVVLDGAAADVWPGIRPAPLPTAGYLDALAARGGLKETPFTIAGYGGAFAKPDAGPQKPGFSQDGARRYTTAGLQSLTTEVVKTQENAKDPKFGGGSCYGDSGGPLFLGDIVVGDTSFGLTQFCSGGGGYQRTDSVNARAFLEDFVTLP